MKLNGKSLLIFGSRTIDDERIDDVIDKELAEGGFDFLITAIDPVGVCARAMNYCRKKKRGITVIGVGLNEARSAGMHEARSEQALKMADHLLAIWDGFSRGTKNEIEMAKKMGVPVTIVTLSNNDSCELQNALEDNFTT